MNSRFLKKLGPVDLVFIADKIGATLIAPKSSKKSPESVMIQNINSLENALEGDLVFLNNPKYENLLLHTKATACIMKPAIVENNKFEYLWALAHPNPYYAYALALDILYEPKIIHSDKIEKTAVVSSNAKISKDVYIGHNTVIEAGVEIDEETVIGSNCFIGYGVKIGKNTRIDSNVSISYSIIGDNVVILPGARIGQDGFGFATEKGKHKKIFHIGKVVIENDVEIGANTTIDRGSVNDTIIMQGARLDNLVQIGHNVNIGVGSVLVAQVGVAGSSNIGNYVALGGQVGVAGHVHVADKVQIAGQSGVIKSIAEESGMYFGTPAMPIREWQKQNILMKKVLSNGTN